MPYYAVIDTNVIVAAILSKKLDTATVKVINAVFSGKIIPLFCSEIIEEYEDVLRRDKFHLKEETIQKVLTAIQKFGIEVYPEPTGRILLDMDDLIFYEVALTAAGSYLVTGNQKHYPAEKFIVSPYEMIDILSDTL